MNVLVYAIASTFKRRVFEAVAMTAAVAVAQSVSERVIDKIHRTLEPDPSNASDESVGAANEDNHIVLHMDQEEQEMPQDKAIHIHVNVNPVINSHNTKAREASVNQCSCKCNCQLLEEMDCQDCADGECDLHQEGE
jgi:hypothetical protein